MDKEGQVEALPNGDPAQARQFVLQRYKESIEFYWRSSHRNRLGAKLPDTLR